MHSQKRKENDIITRALGQQHHQTSVLWNLRLPSSSPRLHITSCFSPSNSNNNTHSSPPISISPSFLSLSATRIYNNIIHSLSVSPLSCTLSLSIYLFSQCISASENIERYEEHFCQAFISNKFTPIFTFTNHA